MKSVLRLIVIIMVSCILVSCSSNVTRDASYYLPSQTTSNKEAPVLSPTSTPLITEKPLPDNQMAHNAYEDAMRNGQLSEIRELAAEYSFYDIDNDGIDELIAYPAYGCDTYWIYSFFEGNINELMGIGQAWNSLTIYPEKSAFSFIGTGHMGHYIDVFYEFKNGRAYVVAEQESYEIYEPYGDDDYILVGTDDLYIVNDKETTEKEYTEFIKILETGKQVKHEDLNWYQWIRSKNLGYDITNKVYQLNETETNYFRFDSSANNIIKFHFNVDPYVPNNTKLQNMKITLYDLNLKPISKTDSFSAFEQMDYKCTISEEGGYYLKVTSEFIKRDNETNLVYEVFIFDNGIDE